MDKHSVAAYLEYIGATLPSMGHGWRRMKCPYHGDKHPSAAINYDENRFKCFGCEVQGDVYDLIMYKQGGSYNEALKFAEDISLPSNGGVCKTSAFSRRVSFNPTSFGRRGKEISFGDS
jgi:hypothetical protein